MSQSNLPRPPKLGGALPLLGHIKSFGKNPHEFMMRLREQLGPVAEFRLFHQRMVLLTGPEASETFYRAPDEVLDQGPAYRFMTPIFGHGVVFDAPIPKKNQQLQMLMPALRDKPMRSYSDVIVDEVENMVRAWGGAGEIDLLHFTKELTLYTSSHCLLGSEFRHELNAEFAEIYHDLEQSIQPIAYIFPNLPLPMFRRRDRARARLQQLVEQIMAKRAESLEVGTNVFQTLIDARYEDGTRLTPHEITGMLVAAIFAGHHTSSGTAAWILIELLRHPRHLTEVVAEIDEVIGRTGGVTFEALRQMPKLDAVIKEVLRLHPPLIVLMRKVVQDIDIAGYRIDAGKYVCTAPSVTHRIPGLFPDPERFEPERYGPERAEDRNLFGWQAFGGGKHKCTGNAFALFQLKAIFSVLLRRFAFELSGEPGSYRDDYTQMVVEPGAPCRVRYRAVGAAETGTAEAGGGCPFSGGTTTRGGVRVRVDADLCQGHGQCMAEAPEIFHFDENTRQLTLLKPEVPPELVESARRAQRYCPSHAIELIDDH